MPDGPGQAQQVGWLRDCALAAAEVLKPALFLQVNYLKGELVKTVEEFRSSYYGLVYGNASLGLAGSLLTNPARDDLLFTPGCLRASQCNSPDSIGGSPGHPWQPMVRNGLAVLVHYYIKEAQYLAAEPSSALDESNEHFNFVWEARPRPRAPPQRGRGRLRSRDRGRRAVRLTARRRAQTTSPTGSPA